MKRLVITADDFGTSAAVNQAVEQAHRHGVLTAASLMVAGDAAQDAVARARAMPGLGVGLHVVLVDGRPVLPPEQVPALVGDDGRFRPGMLGTALRIFAVPSARRQLHAEVEAQFAAFAGTGLRLDHVNAHKHFHLHPTIAGAILRAGLRHGMRSIRAPIEPVAVLRAIDGTRAQPGIETLWAMRMRRAMRAAGLTVPDAVFGLAWSGAMDTPRLRGIIERLPDGLTEIYLHPATGPYPGCAQGYDYAGELAALTDSRISALARQDDIALGHFNDLRTVQ